jgi:hypothetical protein
MRRSVDSPNVQCDGADIERRTYRSRPWQSTAALGTKGHPRFYPRNPLSQGSRLRVCVDRAQLSENSRQRPVRILSPTAQFRLECIRAFAQLTGDESLVAKCSEIRGNIGDFSKDTSKDDICQFECSHPSHAFRGGVLHIRAKIAFRTEASPACNPQDSSTWDSRLSSSSSFREEARAARPDPLRRAA